MPDVSLVVPCYNEATRLDLDAFRRFRLPDPEQTLELVFVDDGSRDATRDVLQRLIDSMPGRARLVALDENAGKAEAVRRGVLSALAGAPSFVGYWDADLATPLDELPRFLQVLDLHPRISFVVGARVQLMGRIIDRKPARHYLGRVFATAASQTLGLPIYDTQCGAKVWRVTAGTAHLFDEPFVSGWIFDVELLARFLAEQPNAARRIYELPLETWKDIAGSKVKATDFVKSARELAVLWRKYPRGRARK